MAVVPAGGRGVQGAGGPAGVPGRTEGRTPPRRCRSSGRSRPAGPGAAVRGHAGARRAGDGPAALPAGYRPVGSRWATVRGDPGAAGETWGYPGIVGGVQGTPALRGVQGDASAGGVQGHGRRRGLGEGCFELVGTPKMLLYCQTNCVVNCLLGQLAFEKVRDADKGRRHTG